MKVRVTGDGTALGTRVVTEDGRDISKLVTAVTFDHSAGHCPTVTVGIALPEIEVAGLMVPVDPDGRVIKRIVYADGGEDEF